MHLKTEIRLNKHRNVINDFETVNLMQKKRTSTPMSFRDEKSPNQMRIFNKMNTKVGFENTNLTALDSPYLETRKNRSTFRNSKDSIASNKKISQPIRAWNSPLPISPNPRPIIVKKEPVISIRPMSTNLILKNSKKNLNQEQKERSISNFSNHIEKSKNQETKDLADLNTNASKSTHSIDSLSEVNFEFYCKEKLNEKIKKFRENNLNNYSPTDFHFTENKIKNDNLTSKSITRQLNPKISQSMNVDKWIEIHRRRNPSIDSKILPIYNQNKNTHDNLSNTIKNILLEKLYSNNMSGNKTKSIRKLEEEMSIEKLQSRVKKEFEQKLKILRKLESRNEFNTIVTKIKSFLDDVEEFKHSTKSDDYKNKFFRLYEYEFKFDKSE